MMTTPMTSTPTDGADGLLSQSFLVRTSRVKFHRFSGGKLQHPGWTRGLNGRVSPSRPLWDIKYHLIWITRYCYKFWWERSVSGRARSEADCGRSRSADRAGSVSRDHIHMRVVVPPQLAPAKLVQFLKGPVLAHVAAGVPTSAEALMGSALVGAGRLLRDGRRGR